MTCWCVYLLRVQQGPRVQEMQPGTLSSVGRQPSRKENPPVDLNDPSHGLEVGDADAVERKGSNA